MSPTTPTVARVAGVGRREGDLTGAPGHGSCAWHELRSVSETGNERDYRRAVPGLYGGIHLVSPQDRPLYSAQDFGVVKAL
jgi:hypothetical protein